MLETPELRPPSPAPDAAMARALALDAALGPGPPKSSATLPRQQEDLQPGRAVPRTRAPSLCITWEVLRLALHSPCHSGPAPHTLVEPVLRQHHGSSFAKDMTHRHDEPVPIGFGNGPRVIGECILDGLVAEFLHPRGVGCRHIVGVERQG